MLYVRFLRRAILTGDYCTENILLKDDSIVRYFLGVGGHEPV